MDAVRKEFLRRARQGVILNAKDLAKFARVKGLKPPSESWLKTLRHEWKSLAMHARTSQPSHYMTTSIPRFGILFLDLMEFHPNLRNFNNGCGAAIVGQETVSQKITAIPVKNKSSQSWEDGVRQMLDGSYGELTTVVSDRDAAVTSLKFREAVQRKYGIRWTFLVNRSKSYHSERCIRYLKDRLSQAMQQSGSKRWVDSLEQVVRDYNSRPVTGTNIKRLSVDKMNFMDVLRQKSKLEDPSVLFNLGEARHFSRRLGDKLFRYKLDDHVLISRDANYLLKDRERGMFVKRSMKGAYGPIVYKIVARILKNNAQQFLTPVYALKAVMKNDKDPQGYFYEQELAKSPKFAGEAAPTPTT